jgi:hypothetical protein
MRHVGSTSVLLAASMMTAILLDRPVHAGVILAVGNPQNNGVIAFDGSLEDFGAAANSPAHASAGNGRASLNTLGSQMRLSFEVSGNALASTGVGPTNINFGAIPILIEGTSGEASGSPVTLQLQTRGNVPPGANTELFINGTLYSANQTYTFNNFSVGSEFDLWAGLLGDGNGDYQMMVTLSVQRPLGFGDPAPEPSSLMLLSSATVPMFVAGLKRKRQSAGEQLRRPQVHTPNQGLAS